MNIKVWFIAAALSMAAGEAQAACAVASLTFKDASGSTQSLCFGGATGQYLPQHQIIDGSGNIVSATSNALDVNLKTVAAALHLSVNQDQIGGTTIDTNSGAKSGGTQRVVIATDQPQLTAKLLVTPDLPANAAIETGGNLATLAGGITSSVYQTNMKQVNGIATSTGTGAVGTGSQRVAVGTDTATIAGSAPGTAGAASTNVLTVQGIASMTKLLVTPDLPANAAIETGGNLATLAGGVSSSVYQTNMKQVNGIATSTGSGAVGTGSQRVAVGTDTATIAGSAPGTAGSASANVLTVQGVASMTKLLVTPDSVALPANQSVNVSQVNGGATSVGAGTTGTGSIRTTVAQDSTTVAGSATIPAGTNIIGKTGIDQTTDVTTNGVEIAPTAGAAAGITSVVSGSAENSHVIKGSPGNLYSAYATNLTATSGFLVLLNATAAPGSDGAITPIGCVPLPGNGAASVNYRPGPGKVFSTGITAAVTSATTCFTLTRGVITAFISGDAK